MNSSFAEVWIAGSVVLDGRATWMGFPGSLGDRSELNVHIHSRGRRLAGEFTLLHREDVLFEADIGGLYLYGLRVQR